MKNGDVREGSSSAVSDGSSQEASSEGGQGESGLKRRRPYVAPAREGGGGFTPITLGTRAPVLPGQGC
ncbi:hypothetical protein [Chondromyces crocatus]|uniref:Uncharacterized protein n=1 Tax=Chondromyces crocatus TaxID=52 RepID=A0A0K1ERK8_CHOCO|nr:hypothetical protein [Chondromyces crocatus]AKT43454.1 uncharacterized protein CMC5_076860 [Chondromyces crocatus]